MKGLSLSTKEGELEAHFAKFGQVVEVKIVRDKVTRCSKGYAFVEYETEKDALKAYHVRAGKD